MSASHPVLVLGIGNILLGDEGIGVRAVEALRDATPPVDADLVDGATGGANLVDLIADRRKVIVIDAMDAAAAPGTIRRLAPEDLAPADRSYLSLHELGLLDALRISRQLDCAPAEVIVLGVQPAVVAPGLELSPALRASIPRILEAVQRELLSGAGDVGPSVPPA